MKDIYVEFKGSDIKGDSRDAKHKDTVEVYSWSHTMRQPKSATASAAPAAAERRGGPGSGRRGFDCRVRRDQPSSTRTASGA